MSFEKDLEKFGDRLTADDWKKEAKEYKQRYTKMQNIATKPLTWEDIIRYRNGRKGK
jgi:hypothetical protein